MNARTIAITLVVVSVLSIASAQLPIPSRPLGFAVGEANAPIVIDGFFDLMCPDSRSIWPGVKETVAKYGPSSLRFNLQPFALPYHHNSYYANQAAIVVGMKTNTTGVFAWMEKMFEEGIQEALSNKATMNSTPADVIKAFGSLVQEANIMSAEDFLAGFADVNSDYNLRIYWKYACSRSVAGTPTMLVNGIPVAASTTWTVKEWSQVLDPLLHPAVAASAIAGRVAPVRKFATILEETTCPAGTEQCQYLPGKTECCTKGEGCVPNVGCRC